MAQAMVRIGVEIEKKSDADFSAWAQSDGRSKRQHARVLMRKLLQARQDRPDDLRRLGLLDGTAQFA